MEAQAVAACATEEMYVPEDQQPPTIMVVNELLAAIFAGDEELLVAEPQECISGATPGLESGQSLRVVIDTEDVVDDGCTVEINLYGSVMNESGKSLPFTLYYFLWLESDAGEHKVNSLLEPGMEKTFAIDLPWPGGKLHEAVFKLDLCIENSTGSRQPLGHGKGFWVFRQKVWEMEIG